MMSNASQDLAWPGPSLVPSQGLAKVHVLQLCNFPTVQQVENKGHLFGRRLLTWPHWNEGKNTHIPHVLGKKSVADCLLVEGWPGRRAGAPGIGKTYPFQICIRSFSEMKTFPQVAHLGGFLHVWKNHSNSNMKFWCIPMLQLHLRVCWQNWYLKCRLRNDLGPYCHDDRRAIFNPTPWEQNSSSAMTILESWK